MEETLSLILEEQRKTNKLLQTIASSKEQIPNYEYGDSENPIGVKKGKATTDISL